MNMIFQKKYILLLCSIWLGLLLVGCNSKSDEVEQNSNEETGQALEETYEGQPSIVKRFINRFSRKAVRGTQDAVVGSQNMNAIRKINRYYQRVERQLDLGGDLVDAPFQTQRQLREGNEVFGWHPYYMGNAYESYNFSLLSTIAYFSYDVDPETGGYRSEEPINGWKTTALIDSAHAKGCKVVLSVTNHGKQNNEDFLYNLNAQQNLIDSLIYLLDYRKADGINIDFENLPAGSRESLTRFIQTLSAVLKQLNPKYQISIALPAVDHTQAFDIEALISDVDRFIIMGYDYHSGASSKPGPVAPLPPKGKKISGYNLQNTVDDYLKAGLPQSKMIMAFPYYGRVWQSSNLNFSDGIFKESLTYRAIKSSYEPFYTMNYDSNSTSYNFQYIDTTTNQYVECWFDNEVTLSKKYDWVIDQKLRGIGIWALGYDNGYTELWQLIDDKFTELPPAKITKSRTIANFLNRRGVYVNTGIAFLIMFMFGGVVFALLKKEVSHELFSKRWFLSSYIFITILLLLLWLQFMGWATMRTWAFWSGIYIGYLIINYLSIFKFKTNNRLP